MTLQVSCFQGRRTAMAFTTQEGMGEIQLRYLWMLDYGREWQSGLYSKKEYTEEMWNELNKKSESRKAQSTHKM